MATLNEVDLSNPHDPKTIQYLQELSNALAEVVIRETEKFKYLQESIAAKKQEENKELFDRYEDQYHIESAKLLNQALNPSDPAYNELQEKLLNDLKTLKDKITEELDTLTTSVTKLTQKVEQGEMKLKSLSDDLSKKWLERKKNNHAQLKSSFIDPKDKNKTILIGKDNQPIDTVTFEKHLNELIISPSTMFDRLNTPEMSDSIFFALQGASDKEERNFLLKMAKRDSTLDYIKFFVALSGTEASPQDVITLAQKNSAFDQAYKKMEDIQAQSQVSDLQEILNHVEDLSRDRRELSDAKESQSALQSLLGEIEAKIDKLASHSAQPKM